MKDSILASKFTPPRNDNHHDDDDEEDDDGDGLLQALISVLYFKLFQVVNSFVKLCCLLVCS